MKKILTALLFIILFGCEEKSVLPTPCPTMDYSESKYGVLHKQDIMIRGGTLYNQYVDGFIRSKKNTDSMMFFMGAMKGSRETENAIYSLTYKPISGDLWTKPSPKPSPLPDTTKRVYYYWWTANNYKGSFAYGENSLQQNHKPTNDDVKKIVLSMMGNNWWGRKYLTIEDIIEFKNQKEYDGWSRGASLSEVANSIRLYRRPNPSPIPDTTKPRIDSTGIVLAKALDFPKYEGQRLLLFDRKGNAHTYYDSAGWIVIDWFRGDDLVYKSELPERFSPKTIDSIVKYSQSPWQEKTTTKPLNIKMQPRWRDNIDWRKTEPDSGWLTKEQMEEWSSKIDTTYWQDVDSLWVGFFCATPLIPVNIIEVPEKPTHLLLVCDSSQANGFRSQRVYWIYGYVIYTNKGDVNMTGDEGITYLDQDGAFLKKNIIVWLSKEIK